MVVSFLEAAALHEPLKLYSELGRSAARRCLYCGRLGTWNADANIIKANYKESKCLEEEEDVEVVPAEHHIITPTQGEVCPCPYLQEMHPGGFNREMSQEYRRKNIFKTVCFVDYLSPILVLGFLAALVVEVLVFMAAPSFSVTTHSFTLPASNNPIKVAFVLCNDMTFSNKIQNTSK